MSQIKKGDIVGRISYGKDIYFKVKKIVNIDNTSIALLKGIFDRVEADSPITDLEKIEPEVMKRAFADFDHKLNYRLQKKQPKKKIFDFSISGKRTQEKIIPGKILHLDGDKKYAEKSYYYYQKLGLNAVVKNIPEYKQPKVAYSLLKIYRPDILVITGHDGMIKRGSGYHDLYNYRNSRHFIQTVKEARRYDEETGNHLVIFAGACQSYFEALISAGANFASSPARILIDFMDPLIIAEKVAITENYKYVTIDDVLSELRDGRKGVDGIGAKGKLTKQ